MQSHQVKPRFRIEVRASTYPIEEWLPIQHESGKRFRFVERFEAEAAIERLRRIQPHLVLRVSPM